MYKDDASLKITEGDLSRGLCGASRPGHFDGVCTVVGMLFNLIRPDIAVFGEKDWQQLAVIRRMVRDLKFPIRIVGHPTVREEDGLAMSSRNRRLTPPDRLSAPRIYQALVATAMEAEAGESSIARLRRGLLRDLGSIPGAETDYAEIVEEETLRPLKSLAAGVKGRALVAVRFGPVRLIDNLRLSA
jgi:pantoate--beta-alanine ligase